jgi:hypothetical protein
VRLNFKKLVRADFAGFLAFWQKNEALKLRYANFKNARVIRYGGFEKFFDYFF